VDLVSSKMARLENIALVADAEHDFLVIMKDGKIYKNALAK
jgi:hypothetical protein